MTLQNTKNAYIAAATVFMAVILLIPPVPISAESSERTQDELRTIFGNDLDLAKKYHEKNSEVKRYEEREQDEKLNEAEKNAKMEAMIDRALHLGKLNARGYVNTEQLMKDIEDGTRSFDIQFPETSEMETAYTVGITQATVTYVCDCPNEPYVVFTTGYVYYTWWGLWKHTISDHDYDTISNSDRFGESSTTVVASYSQKLYPFTEYKLGGGAMSASFNLDFQVTDDGEPPVAIVDESGISITDATSSWDIYWHTSVPGGQSEADGEVKVDAWLVSIS